MKILYKFFKQFDGLNDLKGSKYFLFQKWTSILLFTIYRNLISPFIDFFKVGNNMKFKRKCFAVIKTSTFFHYTKINVKRNLRMKNLVSLKWLFFSVYILVELFLFFVNPVDAYVFNTLKKQYEWHNQQLVISHTFRWTPFHCPSQTLWPSNALGHLSIF